MKIEIIHVADVQIHMRSGSVERGGLRKRITGRRLGMLGLLALNVEQVVSKERLWSASHETAHGNVRGGSLESVRTQIAKLRIDLEPLGMTVETVQGSGWVMTVGPMPERLPDPDKPKPPAETGARMVIPVTEELTETVRRFMVRGFKLQAIARLTGLGYLTVAAAMEQARNHGVAA
jgi:DNA-binding winged helix-turn-helix (wHTH) protein